MINELVVHKLRRTIEDELVRLRSTGIVKPKVLQTPVMTVTESVLPLQRYVRLHPSEVIVDKYVPIKRKIIKKGLI